MIPRLVALFVVLAAGYGQVQIPLNTVGPSWDLLSESKGLSGGTFHNSSVSPTYSGGNPTNNWLAGTDKTLLTVSGHAGYVSHLWLAIGNYTANGLDSATITITVDGESPAGINAIPLEMLFMRYRAGQSDTLAGNVFTRYGPTFNQRGTFSIYLPIPFATSITVSVHNADSVDYEIWSEADYVQDVPDFWPFTQRLKIATATATSFANGSVLTLLDTSPNKRGRLAALFLAPDGLNVVSPAFAFLEGFVKFYIDGEGSPSFASTGTEDYFLFSGDFGGMTAPATTDYSGLLYKNGWAIYAYRWHILDPIHFTTGLKVTWDAGETSRLTYTGTGALSYTVFYYVEN